MPDPIDVVRDFCAAWEARDQQRILDAFTDDGEYHNMPLDPAVGKAAIAALLGVILSPASDVKFEIRQIAAAGDVVLTERIDRFVMGGKTVELPVMGAFEVRGGMIAAWRDYFDMATWTKQTTG
jgi:limonene-1,2-epoxide hydrolase